jgi:hypothetical protein
VHDESDTERDKRQDRQQNQQQHFPPLPSPEWGFTFGFGSENGAGL